MGKVSMKFAARCFMSSQSLAPVSNLNVEMKRLIKARQYKQALDVFHSQSPSLYNDTTFRLALEACTNVRDINSGVHIHKKLSVKSLGSSFIQRSLIQFYMQCGNVDEAEALFSSIKNKNQYHYGSMLKGYIMNNMLQKVLELFERITVPINEVIAVLLFNACAKICDANAMKIGRNTLNRLEISFFDNEILVNAGIDMLMKFGDVNEAEVLFNRSAKKTIVTYGVMMQGYTKNNLFDKAIDLAEQISTKPNEIFYSILFTACASLPNDKAMRIGKKLFDQMPKEYLCDTVIVNSAINMFTAFGETQTAEELFSQMKVKTSYTYSIMMSGYKVNQEPEKCLSLFQHLKQQNLTMHESTWISIIGACSQIGMLSVAKNIVDHLSPSRMNLNIKTALIDMWGKCGDIKTAEQTFRSISQPDLVTYSSMVNAYARNGMGYEAIETYNKIPENIRDKISHICVLNACSHSGLIDEAQMIYSKIQQKSAEIVTSMIDGLSRMAMFDEAQKLIDDYEKSNPSYLVMYMAMLSAARNHRQISLSQHLHNRIKQKFPDEKSYMISSSILLANAYSSVGDSQQVQVIRNDRIKQHGSNAKVGVSWTEVNGQIVKFKAHDRLHAQSDEIYAELECLSNELKSHGYEYDSSWITRPLKNEETIESVLCGHSEKLAIAFNFIQNRRPSVIQITKNLRVCGDCHRATKLIAKIRQCEIIVRDANRIHHFQRNGLCSCQDHF